MVMANRYYTVRYRCTGDGHKPVLIVEDEQGTAYLYRGGRLRGWLGGRNASGRLARFLQRRAVCTRVPEVPPYTLEGLRRLTGEVEG